ncbi:hypothetical protein C0J52_05918 [Blattella germanica]|nr:hypothetical protein C0J52_05918 [Blattella germanica]
MKQRMSRTHKHRKGFKVDCLLDRINMKNREIQPGNLEGYMTLTFLGFYDKKGINVLDFQMTVGVSEVPINPSEDHPPPKAPTISIPTESFSLSNGHLVKSYVLLLRVSCISNGILMSNGDVDTETKLFGSELIVYDKHNRCLLTDGDYELVLQEVQANVKGSPKKLSSWETIGEIKEECGPFEVFSKGPTLKFRLNWTTEPSSGFVDRPKPLRSHDHALDSSSNKENRPEDVSDTETSRLFLSLCDPSILATRHSLECQIVASPIPQGARIDVAINECYDGSYTGSPHDLISQPPGFAFSRNGPVRRTVVSNILVCRPKRPKPSLSEFLELDENEFDGQRPYITGHNRLYHHTTTCLPIYPKEMDVDSEGEHDPKWLQTKTMMMIDDFTDVNEGEKELMKMWNLHVMKHGYVGDCQIPLACNMFLEAKGQGLLLKNLYRNFVLHMCSLFDFGLVSPVTLYTTIQRLQDLIGESGGVKEILQNSWQAQRRHWIAGGCHANGQQEKSEANRRKTTNQSIQMGSSQQHGTTKGQMMSLHNQGRKSTQSSSCNNIQQHNVHKGQTSNSMEISQSKRKSSQTSSSQQNLPLSNIQQNSLKGQNVSSGDSSLMQQRRKSASGLVSHNNVSASDPVMMQQRRRSLGQQNQNQNVSQNHSESLPPLRRKSFHQLTSNSDQSGGKNQILNSQGLVSSLVSEVSHRRKSTAGQNSDVNHVHNNHSSKNSGS